MTNKIANIEVNVTNEHLQKLLKSRPINALSEIIWNSVDADATNVDIEIDRNSLDGIEHIYINDNGHGISLDFIENAFGNLGNSRKMIERQSPHGRQYHGKYGQGRFNCFALGKSVEWSSIFMDNGSLSQFKIRGHSNDLRRFDISEKNEVVGESTGVKVGISDLHEDVDIFYDKSKLAQELAIVFAPYLLAYTGIKITVNGLVLNPLTYIKDKKEYQILSKTESGDIVEGILESIEWKRGNYKNLYLCSLDGIAFEEINSGIKGGVYSHTFYLKSKIIEELSRNNELACKELNGQYLLLKGKADDIIKEIYRVKLADLATKEIKNLKEEKIYPFSGEALTVVEKVERQVFDICAYKIHKFLPDFTKSTKTSRQFTYRLLKEALETNPSSINKILKEVLNLPEDQQNDLANLLEKTTLSSIINTTKLISDRISFLNGLEQILFSNEYHKVLKERSQLHKILIGELWLFGEQYQYGYDDISLKNVLKEHISILGRDNIFDEVDINSLKGLNDIPDIGLWRQCVGSREDEYENLVIELKRPSCIIGQDEVGQIERYAYAVEENKYFDKEKTKWKFVLIGIKLDKYTKRKISQVDRDLGLIHKSNNIEIWVKEWNQVIQEAKGKHRYLRDKLELEVSSNEEGLNYLKSKYNEFLPD